jgi:valyl-tRNA synthetase
MSAFQQAVRAIRNLRAEAHLAPQKQAPVVRASLGKEVEPLFSENGDILRLLCRLEKFEMTGAGTPPPGKSLSAVLPQGSFYLEVEGLIDIASEVDRLRQEMARLESDLAKSRGKLGNARFVENAPQEVVEKERDRLRESEARILRIQENIRSLGSSD